MITFLDCQQDNGLVTVANCCVTSARFAYLVNTSVNRLMRRGDFPGTVETIQVCVQRGCLVFPRYVGTVRNLNMCNRQLPVQNPWYQFINRRECRGHEWHRHLGHEAGLMANGKTCTYSSVWGDGRLIRAYPSTAEDVGKTLRIFGLDNGNQPLRTNNGDGTWSDGVAITLAQPFGSTNTFVRTIDRVVKDVTQGQVFLYGYNAAADQGVAPNLGLEDLAIYDPTETSPTYTKYQLSDGQHGGLAGASCCTGTPRSIVALVKLRAIPVVAPTDLVLIDNLEALKFEFQSVIAGEGGDRDGAKGFEADAIAELNRQIEDEGPDDTFTSANDVLGRRNRTNRCF